MRKLNKPRSAKQKMNDKRLSKVFRDMHIETKNSMKLLDKITSDPEYLKEPIQLKVGFTIVTIAPEEKI